MKKIPQTLDELIDKRIKETENTTRREYGPSREEKEKAIVRERMRREEEIRRREEEIRESEIKQKEEEKRRHWKQFEMEKERIISIVREYPDILSITGISEYQELGQRRMLIKICADKGQDYKGKDFCEGLTFCDVLCDVGITSDGKLVERPSIKTGSSHYTSVCSTPRYDSRIGRGMKGGRIHIGSSTFSGGWIGERMSGGLIAISKDNKFEEIGNSMSGGEIIALGEVSVTNIGRNMLGGNITFGNFHSGNPDLNTDGGGIGGRMKNGTIEINRNIVGNHNYIGSDMSGGEIIIRGGVNSNSEELYGEIGRRMQGGKITIEGLVYGYWSSRTFKEFSLHKIGDNMTGGTIILEKYCYNKGWFQPKVYSKRLVIEK